MTKNSMCEKKNLNSNRVASLRDFVTRKDSLTIPISNSNERWHDPGATTDDFTTNDR
jgi:hypothetical protein